MDEQDETLPWSHSFDVAELSNRRPTDFSLTPGPEHCAQIAEELGIQGITKLDFSGQIQAGQNGWVLSGNLGASLIQACVATLKPVKTRVDGHIERRYLREDGEQESPGESEIPEDISVEQLSDTIDVGQVMVEALALRIPLFPRVPDAALIDITVTEPGVAPLLKEDIRPFAQLKSLREQLEKDAD